MIIDQGLTVTCNRILIDEKQAYQLASHLDLENENFIRKMFRWKKDHPIIDSQIKSIMRISTKNKDKEEKEEQE